MKYCLIPQNLVTGFHIFWYMTKYFRLFSLHFDDKKRSTWNQQGGSLLLAGADPKDSEFLSCRKSHPGSSHIRWDVHWSLSVNPARSLLFLTAFDCCGLVDWLVAMVKASLQHGDGIGRGTSNIRTVQRDGSRAVVFEHSLKFATIPLQIAKRHRIHNRNADGRSESQLLVEETERNGAASQMARYSTLHMDGEDREGQHGQLPNI